MSASSEAVTPDAPAGNLTPDDADVLAPFVRLWTWRVRQGLPPTVTPTPRRTPPAAPPPATPPSPAETTETSTADPRTRLAVMFIERVKAGKVPGWSAGES
ncbi:MAG: hypothetical protein HY905_07270 [Deltaproteobacteria bacterium]|nr:hypothetical protein [Deltaproteobacteria bacterium]